MLGTSFGNLNAFVLSDTTDRFTNRYGISHFSALQRFRDKCNIGFPSCSKYPSHSLNSRGCYRRGFSAFFIWKADKREAASNKPDLSIIYEPDGSPQTYCPEIMVRVRIDNENPIEGSRVVLRVGVENNGIADAENCKARFRLLPPISANTKNPSAEPKLLIWENGNSSTDISAKDFSMLNVVLSDSRSWVQEGGIYGFVAISNVLENPQFVYTNESFGLGDFVFELAITAKRGASAIAKFRMHIETDYKKISMKRLVE